jgi:hypothetical protein
VAYLGAASSSTVSENNSLQHWHSSGPVHCACLDLNVHFTGHGQKAWRPTCRLLRGLSASLNDYTRKLLLGGALSGGWKCLHGADRPASVLETGSTACKTLEMSVSLDAQASCTITRFRFMVQACRLTFWLADTLEAAAP